MMVDNQINVEEIEAGSADIIALLLELTQWINRNRNEPAYWEFYMYEQE